MAKRDWEKGSRNANRAAPPRMIVVLHGSRCCNHKCRRPIRQGTTAWWKPGSGLACCQCGPRHLD
jgi:hypothetical protein